MANDHYIKTEKEKHEFSERENDHLTASMKAPSALELRVKRWEKEIEEKNAFLSAQHYYDHD